MNTVTALTVLNPQHSLRAGRLQVIANHVRITLVQLVTAVVPLALAYDDR
jgi:hypothetical protein